MATEEQTIYMSIFEPEQTSSLDENIFRLDEVAMSQDYFQGAITTTKEFDREMEELEILFQRLYI